MLNGMGYGLHNISRLSNAKSRAVNAENFTGEKGAAAMADTGCGAHAAEKLGRGWKVSPCIELQPHSVVTLMDVMGQGAIKHIWMVDSTPEEENNFRMVLRMYWDGAENPAVEVPYNDFFACRDEKNYKPLISLPVSVTPLRSHNCFWEMPFFSQARITVENITDTPIILYYQIDYTLASLDADTAYFHAVYRHTEKMKQGDVYTVLDGVNGKGQYVGTYMYWKTAREGWWGEGEFKFFLDGDGEYPTITSTGTEDYFLGSYNFDVNGRYTEFCTPYGGLSAVYHPQDGTDSEKPYRVGQRFSMYRWHIQDPIFFDTDIRVTEQALGWQDGGHYCQLEDEIASVAYYYLNKKD